MRPGRLYWPRSASRWAAGYFLATQSQLDKIRPLVYGTTSAGATPSYNVQSLVIDDGTGRVVTTSLWMLPPRQITPSIDRTIPPSFDNANPLFLLELVDSRFFWWFAGGVVTVNEGITTWAQLFSQIVALLPSVYFPPALWVPEAVNANYLFPSNIFNGWFESLPPLLDAVALSAGQRIVRQLDGTVESLTPTTSQTRQQTEITATPRSVMAGGLYSLGA